LAPQIHSRAIFKRPIERGNVVVAEATASELGQLNLEEALQLVLLYGAYEPAKLKRAAPRWLVRYLDEGKGVAAQGAGRACGAVRDSSWRV
jgi:hypothetical protein